MKSVLLSHADAHAAKAAQAALNGLSGVVAVDVQGTNTVSHCGDRLDASVLIGHARRSGVSAAVLSEQSETLP